MAMLQVECSDCLSTHSLRGYVEKEDLVGTKYEHLMDTITEEELFKLQESGEVKDPWEKVGWNVSIVRFEKCYIVLNVWDAFIRIRHICCKDRCVLFFCLKYREPCS